MYKYIILILVVLSNVSAQLLLKKGMANKVITKEIAINQIIDIFSSRYILGGLFFFGLSFLLYLYILSKFQVSSIYPIITSSAFVVLLILSSLLLKETISINKVLGIIVIGVGIWIIFK